MAPQAIKRNHGLRKHVDIRRPPAARLHAEAPRGEAIGHPRAMSGRPSARRYWGRERPEELDMTTTEDRENPTADGGAEVRTPGRTADEQEIRRVVERWAAAVHRGDLDAVLDRH